MRNEFFVSLFVYMLLGISSFVFSWPLRFVLLCLFPLMGLGFYDAFQKKHAILRNFPLLGRFRYLFEFIRPEINQYFVESDTDGQPINRETRSLVYQRAKHQLDTLPFGTKKDVYEVGYEWVGHSMFPKKVSDDELKTIIGNKDCKQPYLISRLNISAMSYGSLSQNALMALNKGAKKGGFAHNTGEGGISPYHTSEGGDLIFQIGTGYFGARNKNGSFSPEMFQANATHPNVKMIELKLSQGAKPGHGGILPAKKLTPEIARIRGVELGKDVLSPSSHSAFSNPSEMMHFLSKLKMLSGGKPVGFKLCIGRPEEFKALCQTIVDTQVIPDFITIDGGEGGTGAAPLEFSNYVGMPFVDGLMFANRILEQAKIRDQIKILASSKMMTGFSLIKAFALGADVCMSARGMMLALGCIQALRCNSNQCPTGVATQDKELMAGLDVTDKASRVAKFHFETLQSMKEILGAMGFDRVSDLRPEHLFKRTSSTEVKTYKDFEL